MKGIYELITRTISKPRFPTTWSLNIYSIFFQLCYVFPCNVNLQSQSHTPKLERSSQFICNPHTYKSLLDLAW